MYKCDTMCYDYTNGHVCKHIHRVHAIARTISDISTVVTDLAEGADCESDTEFDNLEFAVSLRDPHKGKKCNYHFTL